MGVAGVPVRVLPGVSVVGLHASHEQAHRGVRPAETDPRAHAEPGFHKIFLHHVGQAQDTFGAEVRPQLRSAA
jgi:hypothetical protein